MSLSPLQKTAYWLQGMWSCFSWIVVESFKNCSELKFWQIPTHPDDFLWYAERVNGRLAMLTLVVAMQIELVTNESIWRTAARFIGIK